MKQNGSAFVAAAADGKHSAAIKALESEIKAAGASKDAHLASLLLNRGICHQKLHLYRKALKVGLRRLLHKIYPQNARQP